MSVAATMRLDARSRTSAYLDWVQMLTGACLVLFMWSHLFLVSSVLLGPGVMNSLAWFFEATGMAQVGGPLIGLLFLTHFVLAARKVPFLSKQQKVIWEHAGRFRHTDTWLWVVQAVSGMAALLLGSIHMWVVLTDLPITAAKSAARIQSGYWLVLYLILLPLIEMHVGVGFYRIGVKWGFITRQDRKGFKKTENIMTMVFIAIGLITLIRFLTLAA